MKFMFVLYMLHLYDRSICCNLYLNQNNLTDEYAHHRRYLAHSDVEYAFKIEHYSNQSLETAINRLK